MTKDAMTKLQNAIDALAAASEAAVSQRADLERRRLGMPRPGTTLWRVKHQAWLARYLDRAQAEERVCTSRRSTGSPARSSVCGWRRPVRA